MYFFAYLEFIWWTSLPYACVHLHCTLCLYHVCILFVLSCMYIMCGCTFINSVYLVDVPHACVIGKSACNSCGGRASPEAWREPAVRRARELRSEETHDVEKVALSGLRWRKWKKKKKQSSKDWLSCEQGGCTHPRPSSARRLPYHGSLYWTTTAMFLDGCSWKLIRYVLAPSLTPRRPKTVCNYAAYYDHSTVLEYRVLFIRIWLRTPLSQYYSTLRRAASYTYLLL